MKIPVFILFILISFVAKSQYYYSDIVSTAETNHLMQTYLANKVKMVTATGYDENGVKATDFVEVKEIKENGRTLKVSTRNTQYYSAVYNRFDDKTRLISVADSSSVILSNISYQYDGAGRIVNVQNAQSDSTSDFNQIERHQWYYNESGKPVKMWRTINGGDSVEIRFNPDENGNPGEEISYRNGIETDRVYYYFDEKGRITDIVRYNKKVKKLLPDMIFTYDEDGKVIQKINSSNSDNLGRVTWFGYIIWRYIYNENGLKTKEALFDKDQQLAGKIEYNYRFAQ